MTELPIGFFDSGIGGLSVMRHAAAELPHEKFIYYGDSKNAPYGEKTEEEIRLFTRAACTALFQRGIKALVMACNTATTISVREMRDTLKIPVFSIEPAVKPACEQTDKGFVMVFATPATISQARYKGLVDRLGARERVVDVPCAGLAELLEKGNFEGQAVEEYIREKVAPHKDKDISGVVIGCTHYSFISDTIKTVVEQTCGAPVSVHDGMYGLVRHLRNRLGEAGLLREAGEQTVEFISSAGKEAEENMKRIFYMP